MLKPAEFFSSTLANGVKASEDTITLCRGHAQALDAVGIGHHCYLVISCTGRSEVVRYNHTENYADRMKPDTIAVVRDVLATGRKNFAPGTCVAHEWFGVAITEWVKQEVTDA